MRPRGSTGLRHRDIFAWPTVTMLSTQEKLVLPPDTSRLCELRARVYRFCESHNLPTTKIRLIVLALDEVLANIIEHGGAEAARKAIDLSIEVRDGKVVACVQDWGMPFDASVPPRAIQQGVRARRGFGLFLIHRILDGIEYERTSEGRNILTLTKTLAEEAHQGGIEWPR